LGSGGIAPLILDLGTRKRRVVIFTLRPLYPQGKIGEEKNSQPLPGLELPIIQPVAQRCTTELSLLLGVLSDVVSEIEGTTRI
jgi:hypothetical protein